jgi:hypothetical protein
MTTPRLWSFTPLGGSATADPLTLSGWQAPFGRARSGALFNAGLSVRHVTTYYPGAHAQPTVHTFGAVLKPFEIHGRWMDQAIGTLGGAIALMKKFQDLIALQQIVRAAWGELLSYKIFVHDFDAHLEDEQTVVWELKADTLQDESKPTIVRDTPAQNPSDMSAEIQSLLATVHPYSDASYVSLQGLLGQVTDRLTLLVSATNQPAADIVGICDAISDFETAVSSDLGKLASSAQLLRTCALNIRDTNEFVAAQAMQDELEVEAQFGPGLFSGPDWTHITADNLDADAADISLQALLAEVQNQIDRVQLGQPDTSVVAQAGDTFEGLAQAQYGSAGGARAIKGSNAVRYGERPIPGRIYKLPKRAS